MKYFPTTHLLQIAACVAVLCGHASAAIRTVTNLNDSGAGSLRATIAAAASRDTIRFALTGTIVLTSGTLEIDTILAIEGPVNPASLVFSRSNDAEAPKFRLMEADQGRTVSLSGLTLTQGFAGDEGGGAFRTLNGSLTARNCIFSNNTATAPGLSNPPPDNGGAIHIQVTEGDANDRLLTLVLEDCVFSGNSCDQSGGAVGNSLRPSLIGNGLASITTTLERCTFIGNTSGGSGGGFSQDAPGSATVRSCTFRNNTGQNNKGWSLLRSGDADADGCGLHL